MRSAVTPAQPQHWKCVSRCVLTRPCGQGSQSNCSAGSCPRRSWGRPSQAENQVLVCEPQRPALRTVVGVNAHLSPERGQRKICSCSLLPFPSASLQPLRQQMRVTNCPPAERGGTGSCILLSPHHRACSFGGQAAPSPGGWTAATFSSPRTRLRED